MTTIRLLDARRGLHTKCMELFKDATIAESIYRYLCDGIEEREDAEPERKKGKWTYDMHGYYKCSHCGITTYIPDNKSESYHFCRWCGADMREETDNE